MSDMIRFPHLNITFAHVGRFFTVFGIQIAYYGVMIAAGMVAGILLAMFAAKKTGQDPDLYFNFAFLVIILSVIGARAYYVIFSWDYYRDHIPEIFNLRAGGLAIYGGILAGTITGLVYAWVKNIRPGRLLDTAAAGLAVGQAIGRWGNFFNREAFGGYTDGLFAMQLPVDTVNPADITQELRAHIVSVGGVDCIQVHPTFLYESAWDLVVLSIVLFWLLRGRKRFDGEAFLLYLLFYGIGRFFIEMLRTDQLLIRGTQIPVSQLLSALLAGTALVLLLVPGRGKKRRGRR